MADFVVLVCPGCGANLLVWSDTHHLACWRCRRPYEVRRFLGSTSLAAVIEGPHIEAGHDRAASQQAMARLEAELDRLRVQRDQVAGKARWELRPLWIGGCVAGLALLAALFLAGASPALRAGLGGLAVVILAGSLVWSRRAVSQAQAAALAEIDRLLAAGTEELERLRKVVSD